MYDSWHSYPQIYALGHRYIKDLLTGPVLVEEKIDGSQFSFGLFQAVDNTLDLRCRSKSAQINILAPEQMFLKAVQTVHSLADRLHVGWTYRCEYLAKPKHNALMYERVPPQNLILFDINDGHESYLSWDDKCNEGTRLGLYTVPKMYQGDLQDISIFRSFLDTLSCLGGQKVEGLVIKNYALFGQDKKVLMGKFVSEAFKEVHQREWKADNPNKADVVAFLISELKTPARWNKAIQHLREAGKLTDSPVDIGLLIREIPEDILKEEGDYIKQKLFDWAWGHIRRGCISGFPEFYKDLLLIKQFEKETS